MIFLTSDVILSGKILKVSASWHVQINAMLKILEKEALKLIYRPEKKKIYKSILYHWLKLFLISTAAQLTCHLIEMWSNLLLLLHFVECIITMREWICAIDQVHDADVWSRFTVHFPVIVGNILKKQTLLQSPTYSVSINEREL